MNVNVVCVDFDGVINAYGKWQNEGYAVIYGEPIPGAIEALKQLRNEGFLVLVHSTRCGYSGGTCAITEYLNKYNIRVDGVCSNKPPADVYLDDKGIHFDGNWTKAISAIRKAVRKSEASHARAQTPVKSNPGKLDRRRSQI